MKRLGFVTTLAVAASVLFWTPALSCSCGDVDPLEALGYSDIVFTGTVISWEEPPPRYEVVDGQLIRIISGADMIRWRFVASQGWKGEPLDTIAIYSARSGSSCGYEFDIGESYLVYAYGKEREGSLGGDWPVGTQFPAMGTDICIGTKLLDWADEDIEELGDPIWARTIPPPTAAVLRQNFPNPFNPGTQIDFELPREGSVTLRVFDTRGRLVRELLHLRMAGGPHAVDWDGRDARGVPVGSGVYVYELRTETFRSLKRMVLVR
jgi:hypothetical protein